MDYNALASQFGGSVVEQPQQAQQQAAPWAADLSRQDQAKIKKDMYEEGRKRLAALQSNIADGGATMDDLNEFGRLNRANSTGSIWQQMTPDKPLFRSGPSMEMAAIQARLAPAQRQAGSGASSDRDVAMFLRGLPSLENEGPTNKGIREDYERKYNMALEKANAMKAHLDQYGNLMEFDSQWAQRSRGGKTQPAAAPKIRRFNLDGSEIKG
jgi:hypothetical protein